MRRWQKRELLMWLFCLLYIFSYVVLSRRGYAEADRFQIEGFFYFTPENSIEWEYKHFGCVWLFAPLNAVDRFLGTGREPSLSVPLFDISARDFLSSVGLVVNECQTSRSRNS